MRIKWIKIDGYDKAYTIEQQKQIADAIIRKPDSTDVAFDEDGKFKHFWDTYLADTDKLIGFSYTVVADIELPVQRQVIKLNDKINVAVPDNALLKINKVTVMVDCCTEKLQDHLNDSWKIIAICPQPDQRRPDYILGKTVN